jgi:beta-lactam-binding protein with PASTA domain
MASLFLVGFAMLVQSPSARAADTTPPTILSTTPTPGATVSNLSQVTIIFSEPVVGVDAEDLQVDGEGAAGVTGIGSTNFTFSFTQPPAGLIQFYWDADHGILDQNGNAFQPETSWTYNLVDTSAPLVLLVSPPAGATVTRFTQLRGELFRTGHQCGRR